MKMNVQHHALGQNFRGVLQVAVLLVMVLAIGSSCRAQSGASPNLAQAAKPGMSATPAEGTAVAQSATLPAIASQAGMAKPPAKAGQEGVKVHGHWIIDIRNADGTLDKHLDFENGFCTLSNTHAGAGDASLAELIVGQSVPGPWEIFLNSPSIPSFPPGGTPGAACAAINTTSNILLLVQSNATSLASGCSGAPLCFPVLTPPVLTATTNGIVLAGQFTIPPGTSNTTITAVQAYFGPCNASLPGSSSCVANQTILLPFSGTYLTGIGSVPAAPTVIAGQTVAVSLQYSFQ
jgi:hypothetical protein